MKILFTGASSFTGCWFIKELAKAGHQVTAIFRRRQEEYNATRKKRIELISPLCEAIFDCSFGSQKFLEVVNLKSSWDLFCHHAAEVTNYKSPLFDPLLALENNVKNLPIILEKLKQKNCSALLLTGSVFEGGEGSGSCPLRPFSPYGLSKGLTSHLVHFFTSQAGIKLGKFVIPNPFGPYEEARFTSIVAQQWLKGTAAVVSSPSYVRDNIHVDLLAKSYRYFAERSPSWKSEEKFNPSGYPESQGAFIRRFSYELSQRFQLPCHYELKTQTEFPEPAVRINTDQLNPLLLQWDEKSAWDALATYYQQTLA